MTLLSIKTIVSDSEIAENLGLKYMYYNTTRPNVPKSRHVRLPFFGTCRVHKVHKQNNEFNLCLEVKLSQAKNAVIGMIEHIKKLDKPTIQEIVIQ